MTRLPTFITLLGVLTLFIAVSNGCTGSSAEEPEKQGKTVDVNTELLQPSRFRSYVRLVGTIEAANDARLSAEANGRIEEFYVEKGERLQKGDPIAKIDDDQLLKEKQRLEAATQQAKEQYERQKRLWQQDSIGSEIDFLNAQYAYQQSKASLESVEVSIGNTILRAPFDAVIEQKLLEEGEMANVGTPVVRVLASDYVKVDVGVPSRYAEVVNVGDSAKVWLDVEQPDTTMASITFVGGSVDQRSRTFNVEMSMPRNKRGMKVGMIANVKLRTRELSEVIVINQAYLYQKEKGYVIYTVGENNKGNPIARVNSVITGPSYANNIVLESGIEPGTQIITEGSSFVEDSIRINIVDQSDNNKYADL